MGKITRDCPFCGKKMAIDIPIDAYLKWIDGVRIQDALPNIAAEDREVLLTGICPKCWNETFPDVKIEY